MSNNEIPDFISAILGICNAVENGDVTVIRHGGETAKERSCWGISLVPEDGEPISVRIPGESETELVNGLLEMLGANLHVAEVIRPEDMSAMQPKKQPKPKKVITIDGPAGAGKTTQAKRLAEMLDFTYVDTGAMYRAIAVFASSRPSLSGKTADQLLGELELVNGMTVGYNSPTEQVIFIGSRKLRESELRAPKIAPLASKLSKEQCVRDYVNEHVYAIAKNYDIVVEGRDTGTVLFPDADCKVYLTADPLIRAYRRAKQEGRADAKKVLDEMSQRDEQDSNRDIAPLRPAQDATLVDCSDKTLQETTNELYTLAVSKLG